MPSIGVVRLHWLCALLSYVRQCFLCLTSLSSWSFSGSRTTVISHYGHMWETNCMSRSNFPSDSPHFWEDPFPFVRPKLIHFLKNEFLKNSSTNVMYYFKKMRDQQWLWVCTSIPVLSRQKFDNFQTESFPLWLLVKWEAGIFPLAAFLPNSQEWFAN